MERSDRAWTTVPMIGHVSRYDRGLLEKGKV